MFDDLFAIEEYDIDNSTDEDRYNVSGRMNGKWVVATLPMTMRGELTRLISARYADSREKEVYYARSGSIRENEFGEYVTDDGRVFRLLYQDLPDNMPQDIVRETA